MVFSFKNSSVSFTCNIVHQLYLNFLKKAAKAFDFFCSFSHPAVVFLLFDTKLF